MTERRPNPRYESQNLINFALVSSESIEHSEPASFEEAVNGPNSKNWKKFMEEEMKSLIGKKIWKLVSKPKDHRIVQCKRIYFLKEGNNSNDPPRYKARLVGKGFTQMEEIDYNEIISLMIKYKTIRLILALVIQFNWD